MTGIADTGLDVVTGAFSYSGAAIAGALRDGGREVRTITGHPGRAPAGTAVDARPLDFDDPLGLVASLSGATTLFNTYWVRFAHRTVDHERAVTNSRTLFHAAKRAGVRRIVHVSITHPSVNSPWPYFRGKALVERALAECDVSYAIVRPAILFGGDGVLLNNIAWLLRRLPVFAIGGRGDYRIRGIHIDDLARLCLAKAAETHDSVTDAVGPERPTFTDLVAWIRDAVGSRALFLHVPGATVPVLARVLPNGAVDLVKRYDNVQGTFFGKAEPQQDYLEYLQVCHEREERFEPKVEEITEQLIREALHIHTPVMATERLGKISEEQMLQQAIGDIDIDSDVFGSRSAHELKQARQAYQQGRPDLVIQHYNTALQYAESSSCPGGGSNVANGGGENSSNTSIGTCEFRSKECPKCHAKNVWTKVTETHISGSCGCTSSK